MGILNYTTKISVETTISEIEKLLSDSGANKILKEYDDDGKISNISFIINTEKGNLPFKLPMNVKAVMQVINTQTGEYRKQKNRSGGYGQQVRVVPQSMYNDLDQARRVGWRIIKDWLEAQLALFFLQMVKIEEIFLPYMFNESSGKTMFELLEEKGFMQLEQNGVDKIEKKD